MISSATREGIEELQDYLVDNIKSLSEEIEEDVELLDAPTIYNLKDEVDPRNVEVTYL